MVDTTARSRQEENLGVVDGGKEAGVLPALLEVRNLHTEFRTGAGIVPAVDGISYTVERGETVAIVGESGSGKTAGALSLLRLIPETRLNRRTVLRLDALPGHMSNHVSRPTTGVSAAA